MGFPSCGACPCRTARLHLASCLRCVGVRDVPCQLLLLGECSTAPPGCTTQHVPTHICASAHTTCALYARVYAHLCAHVSRRLPCVCVCVCVCVCAWHVLMLRVSRGIQGRRERERENANTYLQARPRTQCASPLCPSSRRHGLRPTGLLSSTAILRSPWLLRWLCLLALALALRCESGVLSAKHPPLQAFLIRRVVRSREVR